MPAARASARLLRAAAIGLIGVLALCHTPAQACTIPVFHYALERWPADDYEVFVFHRGGLAAKDQAAVDRLEERASKGAANCRIHVVDLTSQLDRFVQGVWQAQSRPELPWVVVRYPRHLRAGQDAWSGRLNAETGGRLLDSPARREIARRLLKGDAAVWVLLAGGDPTKDEAASALLRAELKALHEMLEPPPSMEAPDDDEIMSTERGSPPRVAFSVIRVYRDDPAETMFVSMLLGTEPDLHTFSEPIALPIFGRGRVLYALVGEGINPDTIGEACAFLAGPCSCRVKGLNPGIDLLMSVDWEKRIDESLADDADLSPPVGPPGLAGRAGAIRGTRASPTKDIISDQPNLLIRNVLLALGGIALLTVGLSLAVRRRLSRN